MVFEFLTIFQAIANDPLLRWVSLIAVTLGDNTIGALIGFFPIEYSITFVIQTISGVSNFGFPVLRSGSIVVSSLLLIVVFLPIIYYLIKDH